MITELHQTFSKRKGIILAGGHGTRLYPITRGMSKQLLPVYDKPMIYYPLSILMLARIRDILIISTPTDIEHFKRLLGSGNQWGLNFEYAVQETPGGIAQAFIVGEEFIQDHHSALILGDNIFYRQQFSDLLKKADEIKQGATVFVYPVENPERYGVVEFNKRGLPIKITEKQKNPRSHYVVTGLYFYDPNVIEIAKKIKPSARGELEITAINECYLAMQQLNCVHLGRGAAWLDNGTHDSLLEANQFVSTIEKRQGLKIACPEEIAYRMGFIDIKELHQLTISMGKNDYSKYLERLINEQELQPYEIYAS